MCRILTSLVLASHISSYALSEAVLFCLDFAINQRTDGRNVCRFRRRLVAVGSTINLQPAFSALLEFSDMVGSSLNEEKTETALVVVDQAEC
jgi:hypothetical protein